MSGATPSAEPDRAVDAGAIVTDVMEIDATTDRTAPEVRTRAVETLEGGGIVLLRDCGFRLSEGEHELVADSRGMLPTRHERDSRNGRPTVTYDPDCRKMRRTRIRPPARERLEALMARYADWADALVRELLPSYAPSLTRDRVTFRPCVRSKPQGLHVDSSYGRPTEGRGMLRVFSNIDPAEQSRRWQVGERFEPFARRFVPQLAHSRPSVAARVLASLGITKGRRTAYDQLMADLRTLAKADDDYQASAPRRLVEFAPGSSWIAITDLVLHGALGGQNSLDQTFFLPATAMHSPERSSLRILERLSGRRLAEPQEPSRLVPRSHRRADYQRKRKVLYE